jgi:SAM-dependent methyltransferase
VAGADRLGGLEIGAAGPGLQGKHRTTSAAGRRPARAGRSRAATAGPDSVFTRFAADYAAQHPGRAVTILQAGCTTAGPELDLATLQASDVEVVVSQVDDDSPATQAAVDGRPELDAAILAELRLLPLAPRSVDIVQCSMLLHRITNAELVLDRFVAALRPSGLLLLRTADRETAAGFLDRKLPEFVRALAWRASRPGQPGPFAACYEPIASARGIEAFAIKHGLVIAHRQTCTAQVRPGQRGRSGETGRAASAPVGRRLVAWLSRGRLVSSYDELHYVIRKPEDPFARVLP